MEPERQDSGPHRVCYSITVDAPAEAVYALIADPHRHHEVDGSQTVQSSAIGPHELTKGARFSVHMRKFGLPYRLPLKVTQARRPAPGGPGVIEWRQPTGHRWRWEFEQDGGGSRVTESYDASGQLPPVRAALKRLKTPQQNAVSIKESLRRVKSHFEDTGS
ncbi:SRPBCC family protein [Nesterenkonia muleiensis]|uniref:SRPBCC family protein n=1 Tax=Nesterenkonia muleiensis TaxID=2282648 RepID=UPI000E70D174|nr:SRPBCC family protein [Nesterenkonia muleiensis]